jgi:uncharacterized membrane protein
VRDDDRRVLTVLRLFGLREIATGLGILSERRPARWLRARVGGDVMDLAFLSSALASPDTNRQRVATAAAAVVGVTALDLFSGDRLSEQAETADGAVRVSRSVSVNRPAEDLYRFWRDLQNVARFVRHLDSGEAIGDGRARWPIAAPDAKIVRDEPNRLIAWRSLSGAGVEHAGEVRFEPAAGGRGTRVTLEMQYPPRRGPLAAPFAKLAKRIPAHQAGEALRVCKQLMETGEIATAKGPSARARDRSGRRGVA